MNIQQIRIQQKQNSQNIKKTPSFGATFPVIHWVSETNGSAAIEHRLDVVRVLQGKLVRMLNKVTKNSYDQLRKLSNSDDAFVPTEIKLFNYLRRCDIDFRRHPKIRSFYDRSTPSAPSKPVAYAITGPDIDVFEKYLAKSIGIEKKEAKQTLGTPYSDKAIEAIENYCSSGLKFVKSPTRKIYDNNGTPYALHTHFVIKRNRNGKPNGYELVNAKFMPIENNR